MTPFTEIIQPTTDRKREDPNPTPEPGSDQHPQSPSRFDFHFGTGIQTQRCLPILQMEQVRPGANTRSKVTISHSAPWALFLGQEKLSS